MADDIPNTDRELRSTSVVIVEGRDVNQQKCSGCDTRTPNTGVDTTDNQCI